MKKSLAKKAVGGPCPAIEAVFGAVQEIRELPDGYSFRLANETALLLKVADFLAKERLCCPFFGFALQIEAEGGAVWLSLTGREGVKPFIQAEIGQALADSVGFPVSRSAAHP